MEQGKKKLISGADEFVEARKAQIEKERDDSSITKFMKTCKHETMK